MATSIGLSVVLSVADNSIQNAVSWSKNKQNLGRDAHELLPNQSLEPTADRRVSSFLVTLTVNFVTERAPVSGGSAPSR